MAQRWRILLVASQACSIALKYTLPRKEDQRFSTEGRIVSKYCNISKTPGRGSIHPPPLYQGGGMNLRVRPRVKSCEDGNGN